MLLYLQRQLARRPTWMQQSTLPCSFIICRFYPLLTAIAFAGAPLFVTAAGQKKKLGTAGHASLQLHHLLFVPFADCDCNCWCSVVRDCSWPVEEAGYSRARFPAAA
jgi:hypothetical protein